MNGILTISVTFFIHIWVKEKETQDESQVTFSNVVGVVSYSSIFRKFDFPKMKLFYNNPNLRKLSAICLTQFIIYIPIEIVFTNMLITNVHHQTGNSWGLKNLGISCWNNCKYSNIIVSIGSLSFNIHRKDREIYLLLILQGKICQENIDLKVVFSCSGFAILKVRDCLFAWKNQDDFFKKSAVQFLTVLYFLSGGNSTIVMGLVAISLCANSIHTQASMVAINSHSNKICNEVKFARELNT